MYKVFVGREGELFSEIEEEKFIVITPDNESNESLHCYISVFDDYGCVARLKGLVCFYSAGKQLDLYKILNNNSDKLKSISFGSILFSILDNIYEYDKIRNNNNFKDILSAIGDVSYLNVYEKNSRRGNFKKFKDTDIFVNKFLANKERLKAYGNGFLSTSKSDYLNGISVEMKSGASISFDTKTISDPVFPNSIFAIVGKNGLGKSLALKEIYILYGESFNKIVAFATGLITQSYFYEIAVNDDSYINVSKKSQLNYLVKEMVFYREENLSSMFFIMLSKLFSDIRYKNVFVLNLSSREKITICNFFEMLGKGKGFNKSDLENLNISRVVDGECYELSSGEKSLLNIIFNMVLVSLKTGGENLFIFDEPENHLHPNFISQLMSLVNKILYNSNSYAVMATHSPFVVKNLLKENVVVLREKYERVVSERINFNTFGANVETISQFVFGNEDFFDIEKECVSSLVDEIRRKEIRDRKEIIGFLKSTCSSELISEIISNLES